MKKKLSNIPIVFIVSRGRSGSTLLQSLLDAHPHIIAPIESKFVLHLNTKYGSVSNWNTKTSTSFIKDLYTNRKFRLFWNVKKQDLTEVFNTYEILNFKDACKAVYLSYPSMFEKKDIKVIVDKNPFHSRCTKTLLKIFPDAKFIHLVRDPRAVNLSHIKSLNLKNISTLSSEWVKLNEKIENCKNNHPSIFHTVKYELMVSNPKEVIKSVFQFINLPFTPEVLNANKTIKKKYSTNKYLSLNQHKNIRKPINNTRVNKWEQELSSEQINIISFIAEEYILKYNYTLPPIKRSLQNTLKKKIGKLKSELKDLFLKGLFKLPFCLRSFIYRLVSLVKDKQYNG